MANYNQAVSASANSTTKAVYNASGTDIPAGILVSSDDGNRKSGEGEAVKVFATGAAVTYLQGVTTTTIPAGGWGSICVLGPCVCLAKEAIISGKMVQVATDNGNEGKAMNVADAVAHVSQCAGRALTPATASGDYFELLFLGCFATSA